MNPQIVTNQPQFSGQPQGGQLVMMNKPEAIPGVPPGLEYLCYIDQLLIHQQVELFEVITGFETCNKYQIKNSLGQQVYFAGEESDACQRLCCGSNRGFILHFTDNFGTEILRVEREFICCRACSCCLDMNGCQEYSTISLPSGEILGYVRLSKYYCSPRYEISNAEKEVIFIVTCNVCVCECCSDFQFHIMSKDETVELGMISKQFSGLGKEMFTKANNFSINFPIDLEVKLKATLLGAVFIIDYQQFENNNN